MKFDPVIKWTGSKRYQSEEILKHFPKKIGTYFEPFIGSASVLRQLIHSGIPVEKYICSDINQDLINLWNQIKENPRAVAYKYYGLWEELNRENDQDTKRAYFNKVRDRYNLTHDCIDFLFLSRTAMNGLIRYNAKGNFNSAFHLTRSGVDPQSFMNTLLDWGTLLSFYKVEFICCDYQTLQPKKGDFLYLDPPYANTTGMYYGGIDLERFWDFLRSSGCGYLLSFDGISGESILTYDVPKDLFTSHSYIDSGCNTFHKLKGKEKFVKDSLYLKLEPEVHERFNEIKQSIQDAVEGSLAINALTGDAYPTYILDEPLRTVTVEVTLKKEDNDG